MSFRSLVAVAWLISAASTAQLHADSQPPIRIDPATVEAIRTAAEQFAAVFASRSQTTQISPAWLIDQSLLNRVNLLREQIKDWNSESQISRLADDQARIDQDGKTREIIEGAKTNRFNVLRNYVALPSAGLVGVSSILGMTGILEQIPSDIVITVLGGAIIALVGGTVVTETMSSDLIMRNATLMKRAERVREAVSKIFFGRLSELGIPYDRKNPQAWLLGRMDGNVLPDWESLTRKQKIKWANDYKDFLNHLVHVTGGEESEAGKQLLEMANKISSVTPQSWWQGWRSSTVRKLAKAIGESVAQLRELDQIHHFTQDPAMREYLAMDQRALYDYAECFSPPTRDYFISSRLGLPRTLEAYLPKIKEMGGIISWLPNNEVLAPGKGLTRWQVSIEFADSPAIAFESTHEFKIPLEVTDARHLHWVGLPREKFQFSAEFESKLVEENFAERIQLAYEAKFPESACKSALSPVEVVVPMF